MSKLKEKKLMNRITKTLLTKLIMLNNSKFGEITSKLPNKKKLIKNMLTKLNLPLKLKLLNILLNNSPNLTLLLPSNNPKKLLKLIEKKKPKN